MATVYRAVDARLGRTVAIKVLHPEYARDQPFLQRFQHEAEFAPSLGAHPNIVNLYEMLTGHLPFDAENAIGVAMQHLHSEPPSPWDYNPDLPARAVATVMRALEKDPERRYRDAAEFAQALGSQAGPTAETLGM